MLDTILESYPQARALNPLPPSRRNGKIARLPKETRDIINRISVLNAVSRLADSGLRYDKHHRLAAESEVNQAKSS